MAHGSTCASGYRHTSQRGVRPHEARAVGRVASRATPRSSAVRVSRRATAGGRLRPPAASARAATPATWAMPSTCPRTGAVGVAADAVERLLQDADAGRDEIERAAAGAERRAHERGIDGSHGDHAGQPRGHADRAAVVAGGARPSARPGPRVGDGIGQHGRRLAAAEAEIDDAGAVIGGPDDARRRRRRRCPSRRSRAP